MPENSIDILFAMCQCASLFVRHLLNGINAICCFHEICLIRLLFVATLFVCYLREQQFVEIAWKADETKASLKKSIADVEQVIKGLING